MVDSVVGVAVEAVVEIDVVAGLISGCGSGSGSGTGSGAAVGATGTADPHVGHGQGQVATVQVGQQGHAAM